MEEKIISGYCRCLDRNRMVTVEVEPGQECAVDCAYFDCVHRPQCSIAQEISAFLGE